VQSPIINCARQDLAWQFPEAALVLAVRSGEKVPLFWGWLCGQRSSVKGEKFICAEGGYHEHADIGAAKTIRDRALEMLRGDSRVTWYYVPKRPPDITTLKKQT
jgi:hypothetical protein